MPYKSIETRRLKQKIQKKNKRNNVFPQHICSVSPAVPDEIIVPDEMPSKFTITIPLYHTEQYKIEAYKKLITGQFI